MNLARLARTRPTSRALALACVALAACVALVAAFAWRSGDEPAPAGSAAGSSTGQGSGASAGPKGQPGSSRSVRGEPVEPRADGPDLRAWRAGGEPPAVAPGVLARVAPRRPLELSPTQAPECVPGRPGAFALRQAQGERTQGTAQDGSGAPACGAAEARIESIEIDWDWSGVDER